MRFVDLFAGAGGMALGLTEAGHQPIISFDNWQPAVDTLRKNFDHESVLLDLSNPENWQPIIEANPQLIVGGPPCQDFSIAGQRNTEGKRANLTYSFAEIVVQAKPSFFIMENVYSIAGTGVLNRAIELFKEAGYSITSEILDSSYLGIPQARKRFILVGSLKEISTSLPEFYESKKSFNKTTIRDYFKDSIETSFYYAHPRSYKRRAIFSIDEPSATVRGVNRPMPQNYKFHPADKSQARSEIRPLTTKERARVQTFPNNFEFVGTVSQCEQLIGNAVPVKLAQFLGEYIHHLDT